MKKRKKKSDREVLKKLFPPEIVAEVNAIIEDVDNAREVRENPSGKKAPKPWGRRWVEAKKKLTE